MILESVLNAPRVLSVQSWRGCENYTGRHRRLVLCLLRWQEAELNWAVIESRLLMINILLIQRAYRMCLDATAIFYQPRRKSWLSQLATQTGAWKVTRG